MKSIFERLHSFRTSIIVPTVLQADAHILYFLLHGGKRRQAIQSRSRPADTNKLVVFNDDTAAFVPITFAFFANGTEDDGFIKSSPTMVG